MRASPDFLYYRCRWFVVDARVGRDRLLDPDVAAYLGVVAYRGVAAENRGVRVYHHVVLDVGVALQPLYKRAARILVEREASERDALVETDVASYHRRLADYNAGSVIDEEPLAYRRARVDVDARLGVRKLAHDARDDRDLKLVEDMRQAVDSDRIEPGIRHHDLHSARRRRVAVIRCLNVGFDETANFRESRHKVVDYLLRVASWAKERNLLLEICRDLSDRSARGQVAVDARMQRRKSVVYDMRYSLRKCH